MREGRDCHALLTTGCSAIKTRRIVCLDTLHQRLHSNPGSRDGIMRGHKICWTKVDRQHQKMDNPNPPWLVLPYGRICTSWEREPMARRRSTPIPYQGLHGISDGWRLPAGSKFFSFFLFLLVAGQLSVTSCCTLFASLNHAAVGVNPRHWHSVEASKHSNAVSRVKTSGSETRG